MTYIRGEIRWLEVLSFGFPGFLGLGIRRLTRQISAGDGGSDELSGFPFGSKEDRLWLKAVRLVTVSTNFNGRPVLIRGR